MKPNPVIGLILAVVSVVLLGMGHYGLEGIRKGTLAPSSYNWNLSCTELTLAWSVAVLWSGYCYALAHRQTIPQTAPSPETETVEQILERLERRVRQDTADKITGKAS